jgi:hypothetical protein
MTKDTSPNPNFDEFEDGPQGQTLLTTEDLGTEGADYPKKPDGTIDLEAMTVEQRSQFWESKAKASTRGFHKFKEKTDREIEELKKPGNSNALIDLEENKNKPPKGAGTSEFDDLIPNFDQYSDEEKANLRTLGSAIKRDTIRELNNDPAIKGARETYNANKWNTAFAEVIKSVPSIKDHEQTFRQLYFKPERAVPDNIAELLTSLAKAHVYDSDKQKAKEEGADEEKKKSGRVRIDAPTGGDRTGVTGKMTLEDWDRLAKSNPQQFAARAAEYQEALKKGNI